MHHLLLQLRDHVACQEVLTQSKVHNGRKQARKDQLLTGPGQPRIIRLIIQSALKPLQHPLDGL